MKVMNCIALYVERKKANGIAFSKAQSNLLAFGRQVGDVTLETVTTHNILTYLNGPLTSGDLAQQT